MSSMSAPLFVGGVPTMGMNGLPTTFGNYFFVDYENGSDGNVGTSMKSPFKTIAKAYSMCVTNNDDVIVLRGHSTAHPATVWSSGAAVSGMVSTSINRVHMVGLDGAWRPYGQGARISFAGTSGATNIAVLKNTGVRNSFTNIKFDSGATITESIYTAVEAGEYAQYTDCEFYKSTDLDQTGAAELVLNGDSAQFKNCTFGSLADAIGGSSIIRPCVLLTAGLGGAGKVCRDSVFEDCLFWRQCKDTTNVFIRAANATDVERMLLLKHCGFINNKAAANKPAVCIGLGATLTVGEIVLDPLCYASNVTKIATATGVIVTGAAPNNGTGIGVNAA